MRFKDFMSEAWNNSIQKSSKEDSVKGSKTYKTPQHYRSNAKLVGNINGLEIHSSESGSGKSHFTWSPKSKQIHHVIHAAQATKSGNKTRLKFLSAHGREDSHTKTGDVYAHLVKHHDVEFEGTGHSEGAKKMWNKFHDHKDLQVSGIHHDGNIETLHKDSKMYADKDTKDPEERKIGKMTLLLHKKVDKND